MPNGGMREWEEGTRELGLEGVVFHLAEEKLPVGGQGFSDLPQQEGS